MSCEINCSLTTWFIIYVTCTLIDIIFDSSFVRYLHMSVFIFGRAASECTTECVSPGELVHFRVYLWEQITATKGRHSGIPRCSGRDTRGPCTCRGYVRRIKRCDSSPDFLSSCTLLLRRDFPTEPHVTARDRFPEQHSCREFARHDAITGLPSFSCFPELWISAS